MVTLFASVGYGVAEADSSRRTLKLTYEEEPIGAEFLQEVRSQLARQMRGEQINLGPLVQYGVCWLYSAAPSPNFDDELNATPCTDVGVRLSLPLMVPEARMPRDALAYAALELDVTGGWTGNASFDGMVVENEKGTLIRRTQYGRAMAGLVMRMGDQILPYVRMAIGVQTARLQSYFGGFERPDEFEVNMPMSITFGLNIRLGRQFIIGAAINGNQVFGDHDDVMSYRVDGAFHISYAWNP